MNINELLKKKGINSKNDYSFLENDKETMDNLMYVILSGSHAYGTNLNTGDYQSDIDVRIIRMDNKRNVLIQSSKKVKTNVETDTSTYNINTIIKYFANANPNVLEFLGSIDRNALYIHPYFRDKVLNNKDLFLSKRIYESFGGFMKSQLNRFNNKTNRKDELTIVENLMRSIEKSRFHLKDEFGIILGDDINITHDNALLSVNIKNVPLSVLPQCLNELSTMCKNAKKLNELTKDQKYILDHGRIYKHCMHYIRLANMGSEILLTGEINTYREHDHDLLMSIRINENGMWLDKEDRPTEKFSKLVKEKEKQIKDAYEKSKLPNRVDMDKVNNLLVEINSDIITEKWKK